MLLLRTCREPVCRCIHAAQNSDTILALQVSVQQELASGIKPQRSSLLPVHKITSANYLTAPPVLFYFNLSSGRLRLYHLAKRASDLNTWNQQVSNHLEPQPLCTAAALQHSELSVQASGILFLWTFYFYLWDCRPLDTSELKQYLCFQNQGPAVFQPTYSTSATVCTHIFADYPTATDPPHIEASLFGCF